MFYDKDVLNYVAMNGIKWNFTTALAPWQGGFYERLVGMVKRCLTKIAGRKHFTLEQLATLLTEIEAVLNSRPLTYVYEDFGSGFVLTPSHFLVTNRKLGLCTMEDIEYHEDEDFQPNRDSVTKLIESWKKGQRHLDLFWRFWKEEYLMSLRERLPLIHKAHKICHSKEPKEGEIVIVKEDNVPRSSWKLGRVTRLILGRDSKIRSVEIQLSSKNTICRAINYVVVSTRTTDV